MSDKKERRHIEPELRNLMTSLRQVVGNKVYMQDIDAILTNLELSNSQQAEALRYLARDLQELKFSLEREKKRFY